MVKTTIKYHILKWTEAISDDGHTVEYKSHESGQLIVVYDLPLPKAITDFMRRHQTCQDGNVVYTIDEILEEQ